MKSLLQRLINLIASFFAGTETPVTATGTAEPVAEAVAEAVQADGATATDAPVGSADAIDFALLDWSWGGFDGSRASAVDGCRISSLKVGSNVTYKWAAGGCESLGASDRGDYSQTLACLFVFVDGQWKGGKFDWISTSRTSRDLANVKAGYHGWSYDAFSAATRCAFCIVSKDGRRRTNLITCSR